MCRKLDNPSQLPRYLHTACPDFEDIQTRYQHMSKPWAYQYDNQLSNNYVNLQSG